MCRKRFRSESRKQAMTLSKGEVELFQGQKGYLSSGLVLNLQSWFSLWSTQVLPKHFDYAQAWASCDRRKVPFCIHRYANRQIAGLGGSALPKPMGTLC